MKFKYRLSEFRRSNNKKSREKQKQQFYRVGNSVSLKTKLILSFVFCSILPSVVIASFVFSVSKNAIEVKVSDLTEEVSVHLTHNINNIIEETEKIMFIPFSNPNLLNDFSNSDLSDAELFQKKQAAADYFSSIIFANSNINNFFLVKEDGNIFGRNTTSFQYDDFVNLGWKEKLSELNGEPLWVSGFNNNLDEIYLFQTVKNNFNREIGMMVLTINRDLFNTVFKLSENSGQGIFIIDNKNRVVASNLNEHLGSQYAFGEDHLEDNDQLVLRNESSNGWEVIITTERSLLMKEINNVIKYVYMIVIIFVILSILSGIIITLTITKPINNIVSLMKKAEQGNLNVSSTYVQKNEIGQLGLSFNKMLENIKGIIEESKRVSTYAVGSAQDLKRISSETMHTSQQIAAAVEEVAKGAAEQVDFADRTNKEMQELSYQIGEVENVMVNVISATNKTKQLGSQSITNIKELTDKNKEMGNNIALVDVTITKLDKEITEITDIIKLIDNISEQTNLLSLNASIEAARAGEAGKGFAVVAQEVRKLSDQSKISTKKITKVIEKILLQTEHLVKLVEESMILFDEQTKSLNKTKGSFEDIISDTSTVISGISVMENSIKRINDVKEQVENSISEMVVVAEISSSTTEEVTATTEEQASAANELGRFSESLGETILELEKKINVFKIS